MLKINKKISAYNHFNSNNIKYIVLHDVGAKSTAKNNVDYFAGGNRGASAHYFVDDTSIWQSVEDKHGAWHCGDGYGKHGITNQNSIGIEMCLPSGTVTAKTEQNTLELVKYLMAKYNVPTDKVVRHYDASRKNCPAQFNLDGKWTRWFAFKAKLAGTTTTTATAKSKFKVGDKVKVKALYVSSTGGGKSTKSAGKIGVIKRDVGKGKRYLVENWGWAHANDIQLVSGNTTTKPKPTPNIGKWIAEKGRFYPNFALPLTVNASGNGALIANIFKNQYIEYDAFMIDDKYVWIRQPRGGGKYGYMATGNAKNGKRIDYWGTFK